MGFIVNKVTSSLQLAILFEVHVATRATFRARQRQTSPLLAVYKPESGWSRCHKKANIRKASGQDIISYGIYTHSVTLTPTQGYNVRLCIN